MRLVSHRRLYTGRRVRGLRPLLDISAPATRVAKKSARRPRRSPPPLSSRGTRPSRTLTGPDDGTAIEPRPARSHRLHGAAPGKTPASGRAPARRPAPPWLRGGRASWIHGGRSPRRRGVPPRAAAVRSEGKQRRSSPDGHGYARGTTLRPVLRTSYPWSERARPYPRANPFESALERHRGLRLLPLGSGSPSAEWEGTIATRLEVDVSRDRSIVQTIAPERDGPASSVRSDVLMGLRPFGATPRRTIALVSLDFHRRGLGPPPLTLRRPAAERATPPRDARLPARPCRSPGAGVVLGRRFRPGKPRWSARRTLATRDAWERGAARTGARALRADRDLRATSTSRPSSLSRAGGIGGPILRVQPRGVPGYADAFARHPGLAGRPAADRVHGGGRSRRGHHPGSRARRRIPSSPRRACSTRPERSGWRPWERRAPSR